MKVRENYSMYVRAARVQAVYRDHSDMKDIDIYEYFVQPMFGISCRTYWNYLNLNVIQSYRSKCIKCYGIVWPDVCHIRLNFLRSIINPKNYLLCAEEEVVHAGVHEKLGNYLLEEADIVCDVPRGAMNYEHGYWND